MECIKCGERLYVMGVSHTRISSKLLTKEKPFFSERRYYCKKCDYRCNSHEYMVFDNTMFRVKEEREDVEKRKAIKARWLKKKIKKKKLRQGGRLGREYKILKLTEKIKFLFMRGYSFKRISKRFGFDTEDIRKVIRGEIRAEDLRAIRKPEFRKGDKNVFGNYLPAVQ